MFTETIYDEYYVLNKDGDLVKIGARFHDEIELRGLVESFGATEFAGKIGTKRFVSEVTSDDKTEEKEEVKGEYVPYVNLITLGRVFEGKDGIAPSDNIGKIIKAAGVDPKAAAAIFDLQKYEGEWVKVSLYRIDKNGTFEYGKDDAPTSLFPSKLTRKAREWKADDVTPQGMKKLSNIK